MTLFINCCPRGESRTERLARALLRTLGEYEKLRLYDEPLHPLGRADIAKRDALLAEKKYDDEMFRYARQFAAADRLTAALATTTGRPSRRTASAFRPSSSWKPKTSTSWAQTRKRSSTMPSRPTALRKIKLV